MDAFISYASEDKVRVVRKLAQRLTDHGLSVWYDEFALRAGDSLRASIDLGLGKCDFGIVILSKAFFEKKWPQQELNGLFAREVASSRRLIIPVWHEVTAKDILEQSPMLADRLALLTSAGLQTVAAGIVEIATSDQDLMYERAIQVQTGSYMASCNRFYTLIELEKVFGKPGISILFDYPRKSWKRERGEPLVFYVLHNKEAEPEELFRVAVNNSWVGAGTWEQFHFDKDNDKPERRSVRVIIGLQLCSAQPADYRELVKGGGDRVFKTAFLAGLLFTGDHGRYLDRLFEENTVL